MILQFLFWHISFSRTFQESPSYSSTFQVCANPGLSPQGSKSHSLSYVTYLHTCSLVFWLSVFERAIIALIIPASTNFSETVTYSTYLHTCSLVFWLSVFERAIIALIIPASTNFSETVTYSTYLHTCSLVFWLSVFERAIIALIIPASTNFFTLSFTYSSLSCKKSTK